MAEARLALELDGVSAGYGETVVIEDVRLTLAEGERLSVIGRNGVGKSTLLGTVMVSGAIFASGTPREIEANAQVRAVYLGQAARRPDNG